MYHDTFILTDYCMNKDSIIQFVGFITNLNFDEFVAQWERYAKEVMTSPGAVILQQETDSKSRYKYLSQHEYEEQNFRFDFMQGRSSEHFPDQKVKVEQLGGYTPLDASHFHHDEGADIKTIAFISHRENDIGFYRALPHRHLNIYQAYYESCAYGYILEFFTPEAEASELLRELKKRPGIEVAAYRECLIPHA
jgi:hypothetical protein